MPLIKLCGLKRAVWNRLERIFACRIFFVKLWTRSIRADNACPVRRADSKIRRPTHLGLQPGAGNHWRAISLVNRKRSNSAASTLHPFPTFLAWILPLTISFRNVGREMRRYWQASQVLKTCFWPFDEEPLRRRSGLTRRSGILRVSGGITFFLFFRSGPAGTKFEKIAHSLVLDHDSFIGRESVFL